MKIAFKDLDFGQPFNRGASMRELGLPVDGVILEIECKATWIEGWKYADDKGGHLPIWRLALPEKPA